MATYTRLLLSPDKSAQVALGDFQKQIDDSQARDKTARKEVTFGKSHVFICSFILFNENILILKNWTWDCSSNKVFLMWLKLRMLWHSSGHLKLGRPFFLSVSWTNSHSGNSITRNNQSLAYYDSI